MLVLEIVDESGAVHQTCPVAGSSFGIGRAPDMALRLDDRQVSGLHCRIEAHDGQAMIIDQSTNGTWLNGIELAPGAPTPLRAGDEIMIGGHRLRARALGAQAPDPWRSAAAPRVRPAAHASQDWASAESQAERPPRDLDPVSWEANSALDSEALVDLLLNGLVDLLALRAKQRRQAGAADATDPAAPFATSRNATEVRALLAAHPAPAEAVRTIFAAIEAHDTTRLRALQSAFRGVMRELAPATLMRAGDNDAARWKAYCDAFGGLGAENGIAERLARLFAESLDAPR